MRVTVRVRPEHYANQQKEVAVELSFRLLLAGKSMAIGCVAISVPG
jgi:hypothetical protein